MFSYDPIPDQIRAGVLRGPQDLQIETIPQWPLADYGDSDLVLIQVAACGVCGSDFRYYAGENPWAQHTLGRFVPNPPNIVLGHEYAGVIVAVQSEANRHRLGQRVAPICSKVCGSCEDCLAGRSRLCPNTIHLGHGQGWGDRPYFPGAYAHYVPSWGSTCFPISDQLSFPEAAMMDILAVCLHVAETGGIQAARPVLCIGAGPAGNGIAQFARALGASRAVLIDPAATARDVALRQSLGDVIDPTGMSTEEITTALRKFAPAGFGTVFDTVGSHESLSLGIANLGKAATLVNLAVHDEPVPINFLQLGGERRITTSCNFEVGDYPRALAFLEAGRVSVKEWITPIGLDEVPDWFRRIHENATEKGAFKLVVDPWRSKVG